MNSQSETMSDLDRHPVSNAVLWGSVAMDCIAALAYFAMLRMVPRFSELFAGFGADLPALTRFVISSHAFFGLALLVTVVPSIALFIRHSKSEPAPNSYFLTVIFGFVATMGLAGLSIVAMYLPIFKMGSVV